MSRIDQLRDIEEKARQEREQLEALEASQGVVQAPPDEEKVAAYDRARELALGQIHNNQGVLASFSAWRLLVEELLTDGSNEARLSLWATIKAKADAHEEAQNLAAAEEALLEDGKRNGGKP